MLWSEDFSNSEWTKASTTPTYNVIDADGGMTAVHCAVLSQYGSIYQLYDDLKAGDKIGVWVRSNNPTELLLAWAITSDGMYFTPTTNWEYYETVVGEGGDPTRIRIQDRAADTTGHEFEICFPRIINGDLPICLLYTSDAADE